MTICNLTRGSRAAVIAFAVILGLTAVNLLTGDRRDPSSATAAGGGTLRNLRSADDDAEEEREPVLKDLLAKEVARMEARRSREVGAAEEDWEPLAKDPPAKEEAPMEARRSRGEEEGGNAGNAGANKDKDDIDAGSQRLMAHLLQREARRKDAGRVVPKILHLVALGEEPPYWRPVLDFVKSRASRQGFETRLWGDPRAVDDLVSEKYPRLRTAWTKIKRTGEGARMADFARLLAVHAHGGAYLELDMIPCDGLDELVGNEPGMASFPFTQAASGQVSNGAFAAPAGHPVLTVALDLIASNDRVDADLILDATGPTLLAHAIKVYAVSRRFETLPSVYDKEEMPLISSWTAEGDVRLGTFHYQGGRDSPETAKMNLWHLAFASWVKGPSRDRYRSKCEVETDLIPSFLEENCDAKFHLRFSECGKTVA